MHRHFAQHFSKAPFALKSLNESASLQEGQDAWGNAAAEVDAAGRQHFEHEIASLRRQHLHKEAQRVNTEVAGMLRIKRRLDDDRRMVVSLAQLCRQPIWLGITVVPEIVINIADQSLNRH